MLNVKQEQLHTCGSYCNANHDRFFFASQVTKSGSPVPYSDVNGAAHGNVYLKLVTGELGMSGWDFRFIADSDDNIIEANE